MEEKESGAGLGLVSVLHSVSKLVFNLAPSYSTEVIGLLDMELFAHGKVGARSVHLFTAAASTEVAEQEAEEAPPAERLRSRGRAGGWLAAAVLGAAVAVAGTTYYLQRDGTALATSAEPVGEGARARTVTVHAEPEGAQITIGGKPAGSGVPVQVSNSTVEIRVTYPGYRTWTRTLTATSEVGAERIYVVRLDQAEEAR
jgi:hypothetical protein